jgi:glycosyltransferase involved in cell wall biosynthesis/GT2 family glycosyltransferase
MTPRLIVSIDTECDKQPTWHCRSPLAFEGIHTGIGERLQPLFAEFGVRPVYFLSPEVLCDRQSVALLRTLDGVELAAHLHTDFILPRIKTWDFGTSIADDMQRDYDPDVEHAKMAVLTEMFAQQIGCRPVSFRAGRFGVSDRTGRILADLGYKVDSSVTPHIRWTDKAGLPVPDFRGAPEFPYRVAENGNLWQRGAGPLLEIPVTILPTGVVPANKPAEPVWFRPWYSDAETLAHVLRYVVAQPPKDGRARPLVMMFHNMEVIAGASPYPQTEADVTRYLDMLKRTFELADRLGVKTCTMQEYHREFLASEDAVSTAGVAAASSPSSIGVRSRTAAKALTPELRLPAGLVESAIDRHDAQGWFKYIFRERAKRWDVWRPCVWIAEHFATDAPVLSIGCGAAFNLFWLAERGFTSLSGFDIDPKAIAAASEIAREAGLEATLWVDDGLKPERMPERKFAAIEALNWTHLLDDFSLERLLETYLPYLADDGVFIVDTIDAAFDEHPDSPYCTQDWKKPIAERRPSEYRTRLSEAQVRDMFVAHGFTLECRLQEPQTIAKAVYVARRTVAGAGATRPVVMTSTRPTLMTSGRPRVLLIADVPNWIFARHCHALVDRLSDEFTFTVKCRNEPFNEDDFDLIYPLEWNLVAPGQIRRPGKYVTGVRSHRSWNVHDFEQFVTFLRDGFQRVHAVSRRLHQLLEPFVPGLVYLSHGVDTRFFAPDAMTGPAVPRDGKRLRIGWAGNRKATGKGVEIIEPLGQVPQFELVTCGYGHRHLTQHEMREFYASLDVYVCASIQEGHNNSLMEAAAMELAIVTADNGTVPEYLQHGANALIVEREYPAFLTACQELAGDPERRRALGKAARQAVVEHFDWGRIAEGYRALFRSALEAAPGARPVAVTLRHPARIVAPAPAPAAAGLSNPSAVAAATASAVAKVKGELRRATHLNEAARLIVPAIVSRRIEEIVVYGAGEAGRALREALGWHRVRVSAFVDRDPAKVGTIVEGVDVISLDEAVKRGVTTFAIGSFAFAAEIRQTIESAYARDRRHPVIFGGEAPPNGRVSVIVCTHGERSESFELLVQALERQAMDFELIVVVGKASESLRRVVTALADRARVVECLENNISRARNIGIRAAGGDIIAFIDDDALPADREWLARLTAPLREALISGGRIAATGGAVISGYSKRPEFDRGVTSSAGFQRSVSSGGDSAPPPDGSKWLPRVPGGNGAYFAAALREVGGFDEQYAYYLDEVDVCMRLIAKGYGIVQVDDAVILHYPGPSALGPAHFRSRRLVARSDAYFVMRHTSGSKASRAWRAVKYLPVKPYFRLGAMRRRAGLMTPADIVNFHVQCAAGLAAGIWAGSAAATTADAGGPAPAWQPFTRKSESRGSIAVRMCSRALAGWTDALAVAAALSRAGYDVLPTGEVDVVAMNALVKTRQPLEWEEAADVWDAASIVARLSESIKKDSHPIAMAAEVVIGSELVARLRAAFVPRVVHVATENLAEGLAPSPLGRWLCLGRISERGPVQTTVADATRAVDGLLAEGAGSLGGVEVAAADAMTLIARVWAARLRDDVAREPGATPWPLRMENTWAAAAAVVRDCVNAEPRAALELALAYSPHVRAANPALAAAFDYHAARALRLMNRAADAWPLYERILDGARTGHVDGPIHAGACYHLAVAAAGEGRAERARDLLTECLRVQPDHGAAQRLLEQVRQNEASAA